MRPLRLGTRASPLALAQTYAVIAALATQGQAAEAVTLSTRGDRDLSKPLHQLGDKGLFTAELEAALRSGDVDAAVHSAKDISALDQPGLPLVAALPREAAGDVLVRPKGMGGLSRVPQGGRVGSSSLRRAAQMQALRPDIEVVPVRGNLGRRLGLLADGAIDALILAQAGLNRLGLSDLSLEALSWLPAPCQGIVTVQAAETLPIWTRINHTPSYEALMIERALVRGLGASCRLPVACRLRLTAGAFQVEVQAWHSDGSFDGLSGDIVAAAPFAERLDWGFALGTELKARLPAAFFEQ